MNKITLNTNTTTTNLQEQRNKINEVSVFKNEDIDNNAELVEAVQTYFNSMTSALTLQQKKEFGMLCKLHNLNPLKREIYAIPFGNQMNIVTSYQKYVSGAEETGKLEGKKIDIQHDENGRPTIGIFRAKRKDQSEEFKMQFIFKEGTTERNLGASKPTFMFQKVIYANGMRGLFPTELGDKPYIQEELGYANKENDKNIRQNYLEEKYAKEEEECNDKSQTLNVTIE